MSTATASLELLSLRKAQFLYPEGRGDSLTRSRYAGSPSDARSETAHVHDLAVELDSGGKPLNRRFVSRLVAFAPYSSRRCFETGLRSGQYLSGERRFFPSPRSKSRCLKPSPTKP